MKATPTPKPGGVPMKASPNFRNKNQQPLPPGAMQRASKARVQEPAVKPKAKPLPLPKARTSSPRPSTAPGKAPTSVPSKTAGNLPAGAVLGYVKRDTAAANAWVKKHPKKAAAESRRNTV